MVDFTESMLGIASPSVGAATVPSAGLTTMLNVVLGASGLSAQAVPVTRAGVTASVGATATGRTWSCDPLPLSGGVEVGVVDPILQNR